MACGVAAAGIQTWFERGPDPSEDKIVEALVDLQNELLNRARVQAESVADVLILANPLGLPDDEPRPR